MSDLLSAVDALTKPRHSKTVQSNEAGITCVSPVELPPLLDDLNDAIYASMGGNTSGASDPATRAPVNILALQTLMRISEQVAGWARMAGVVVDKENTTSTLRRWYVKFSQRQISGEVESMYVSQMKAWESQIINALDPPREKDLPSDCPSCGASEWWKDGERFRRPLVIRYRADDGDMIDNATGMCRACAQVWSARALQYEIENVEASA